MPHPGCEKGALTSALACVHIVHIGSVGLSALGNAEGVRLGVEVGVSGVGKQEKPTHARSANRELIPSNVFFEGAAKAAIDKVVALWKRNEHPMRQGEFLTYFDKCHLVQLRLQRLE